MEMREGKEGRGLYMEGFFGGAPGSGGIDEQDQIFGFGVG